MPTSWQPSARFTDDGVFTETVRYAYDLARKPGVTAAGRA
jgi:hypothetical protein